MKSSTVETKLIKRLLFALFIASPVLAGTTTTNLGLYKPATGETGWGDAVSTSFDTIDSHVAILPVSLSTAIVGILGSEHMVSTTAFTGKQNVFTDTNSFQKVSASSFSVNGPLNVYGLTANQCVQVADATGLLTTSGASCGGSGGASKLGVNQNGTSVTTPTFALNGLSPPFLITAVGGGATAQFALDGSSVTLFGNNAIKLGTTLQTGATFYVSSGTVAGQFNANKVVASTLSVSGTSTLDSARITGAGGLTIDALTSGNCVQAGTNGLLTVIGTPCLTSASSLTPGSTVYIRNTTTLQSGATAYPDYLYVGSSASINGPLYVNGNQTFPADKSITVGSSVLSMTSNHSVSIGETTPTGAQYQFCAGVNACQSNSGLGNIGIGFYANSGNIGLDNIAIGASTLETATGLGIVRNVAIGVGAMLGTAADGFANSTAVGYGALGSGLINSLGECTAVGSGALGAMTLGIENTAVGFDTLGTLLNGINNTAVGNYALYRSTNGNSNTALGEHAGGDDPSFPASPGYAAVHSENGLFLGVNSGVASTATYYTDAVAIGPYARVSSSYTIQMGGSGFDSLMTRMSSATVDGSLLSKTFISNSFNTTLTSATVLGSAGFNTTYGITAGTMTVTGYMQLASKTKSQLSLTTPTVVGQQYYCSDCTTLRTCISSGTLQGAFSSPVAVATACN